jgi:hypothetical protein
MSDLRCFCSSLGCKDVVFAIYGQCMSAPVMCGVRSMIFLLDRGRGMTQSLISCHLSRRHFCYVPGLAIWFLQRRTERARSPFDVRS